MAQQSNQHLKVYNQFNAGVQNVPSDHLINDAAFSKGVNFDLVDSTLRPVRTDKLLLTPTLPLNTKQYIKENIKGQDTDLMFDTRILYINYGDTVYYLENTEDGSPLKQIAIDGSNDKVNALPTISGDVTVSNQGNVDISTQLARELQDIDTAFTIFYAYDVVQYYQTPERPHTPLFFEGVQEAYDTFLTVHQGETVTQNNVDEIAADLTASKQLLVDTITNTITEMSGTVLSRVTTMAKADISLVQDSMQYLYHPTVDPNILSPQNDEVDDILNRLMEKSDYLTRLFNAIMADSISKYIMWHLTDWGINFYGSFYTIAKESLDYLGSIYSSYTTYIANNPSADIHDYNVWMDILQSAGVSLTQAYQVFKAGTVLQFSSVQGYSIITYMQQYERFNTSYTSLNQLEYAYNKLRTQLTTLRERITDVNFTTDVIGNIRTYSVVGRSSKTNAYTNMLRTEPFYAEQGFTLSWTPSDEVDEYYIYELSNGDFFKVADTTDSTIDLTLPLERGGPPSVPYRIAKPHTDYTSIAEYKGSIFLNRKNSQEIYYTMPNNPHDMKVTSYIKMPQNVKAMKTAGSGLFIWTTNNTLFLLTGSPFDVQGNNTLAIKLVGENVDIFNKEAVSSQDALVVWLSDYAIHNTSGYGSADATKYVWTPPKGITPIQTIVNHKNIYFLCKQQDDSKLLIEYDTTRRAVRTIETDMESLSTIDNDLVGVYDSKAYSIFNGDTYKEYDVELKRFAGYSFDLRQRFSNITVFHTPVSYKDVPIDITNETKISIYIDEALVVDSVVVQGLQSTRIPIPSTNNVGYSIKVRLTGRLCIKSVRLRYAPINYED